MNQNKEEYSPVKEAERFLANMEKAQKENPSLRGEIFVKASRQLLEETKKDYQGE